MNCFSSGSRFRKNLAGLPAQTWIKHHWQCQDKGDKTLGGQNLWGTKPFVSRGCMKTTKRQCRRVSVLLNERPQTSLNSHFPKVTPARWGLRSLGKRRIPRQRWTLTRPEANAIFQIRIRIVYDVQGGGCSRNDQECTRRPHTLAPSRTVAPMPMSELSPMVQACTVAQCPGEEVTGQRAIRFDSNQHHGHATRHAMQAHRS